ncbi:hypothetical protein PTTW11_06012 [Pyrenophora teres f. teres]|uniref:Uncharacterized protein n=1 Tax=Pyrenophora teres f. teres TaxID=97479 RepID=A0A6S6W365_9PLEO|nr:hypothetical protein PTTW11_06012 [Pyrenophora teres f. teres]
MYLMRRSGPLRWLSRSLYRLSCCRSACARRTSCVTILNFIQILSDHQVDRTGACVTLKAGIPFGGTNVCGTVVNTYTDAAVPRERNIGPFSAPQRQ